MAPSFADQEIVNHLNYILEDDDKVSISNIKNPTSEFAREIIVSALNGMKLLINPSNFRND